MTQYQVGLGHNLPLEELVVVTPQPRGGFIRPSQRDYVDGGFMDQALYSPPTWNITNRTRYQAILSQFGVNIAKTALVTWYTQDETFEWVLCNGTAFQPQMGEDIAYERFFPRSITLYIQISEVLEGG